MEGSILVHSNFQVNKLKKPPSRLVLRWQRCRIFREQVKSESGLKLLAQKFSIMMDQSKRDAGTIIALIHRMETSRLPRARRLLEKVNMGETLGESDINFLRRVHDDYQANQALILRNPDFSRLMASFIDLYAEIIATGLANEKAR